MSAAALCVAPAILHIARSGLLFIYFLYTGNSHFCLVGSWDVKHPLDILNNESLSFSVLHVTHLGTSQFYPFLNIYLQMWLVCGFCYILPNNYRNWRGEQVANIVTSKCRTVSVARLTPWTIPWFWYVPQQSKLSACLLLTCFFLIKLLGTRKTLLSSFSVSLLHCG